MSADAATPLRAEYSPICQTLPLADRLCRIVAGPDHYSAALYHGTVDLDACLVAADRRDPVIAGARAHALQPLPSSKFAECGCCRSAGS